MVLMASYLSMNEGTCTNEAGTGRIDYAYDATGAKLSKRVTANGQESVTEYAGAVVYRDGALDYVSLAGGYLEPDAPCVRRGTAERNARLRYVYRYSDHDCVQRAHRAKRNAQSSRLVFSDTPCVRRAQKAKRNAYLAIDREMEIRRERNYYPACLRRPKGEEGTHKGYNNVVNGTDNPIAYNGKENVLDLGLNIYDLGARHMDPALGRFMVIDPMADFVNYQSPYALADNNPIGLIDEYGLGSRPPWWLTWLVGGEGRNCSCKRREGVVGFVGRVVGSLFEPKPNKRKRKRNRKKKSNITPSTRSVGMHNEIKQAPITFSSIASANHVTLTGISILEAPQLSGRIASAIPATPRPTYPTIDGRLLEFDTPVTFSRNVFFNKNSSTFKDTGLTEKTLSDLIMTLKEYPQLKLLILGNVKSSKPGKNQSTPAQVNG